MNFRFIILFLLFLSNYLLLAQDNPDTSSTDSIPPKKWKTGGVGSLNFSQVHLENWAAGGKSSFSATGFLSIYANYKRDKSSWDNTLDLAYGLLREGKDPFNKSDDKIDFSSKFDQKSFLKKWNFSEMIQFKSQFSPGYDASDTIKISDFMAPGYLIAAIGLDYKPSEKFTLLLSPLTSKITFVFDKELSEKGAFGVDIGKTALNQFGGYIKTMFKDEILKNVTLQLKLDLFSNYLENPQNIDINSELLIAMKVNKFLSANITANVIYDDDIVIAYDSDGDGVNDTLGPRTQFKEVLGIGLSYKF